MKNSELEQLINDKLNSAAISDFAPNGLQVEGRETVHKIVTGVTACRRCWMRPSVCRRMR
nr:metal-binding protein [Klebsiella pneumoniae]